MNRTIPVRRRFPRAQMAAPAFLVLDGGRTSGPFLVENLSAGGALLTGDAAIAPGTTVTVQLRLRDAAPIAVAGRVVREVPQSSGQRDRFSFAVRFRDVSANDEDRIQSAVLASIEESREQNAPAVLVLDVSSEDRHAVARILVELGQRALPSATFLETLRSLQDPSLCVGVALVDASATGLDVLAFTGIEVLEFLANDFPDVRRVLMARSADPSELLAARSSALADAVLEKPADAAAVAIAIGADLGTRRC